jgi:tellurite methyltransferase
MNQQLLRAHLANTDLDIIDQLLKGMIKPEAKILDTGCGEGRNLTYFIKNNFPVWAIDSNPSAVKYCQYYAKSINQNFPVENIISEPIEDVLFPAAFFDIIFCINMLHDAASPLHLHTILKKIKNLLTPSGSLFLKVNKGTIEENELREYFKIESPGKNEITAQYNRSFWVLQLL